MIYATKIKTKECHYKNCCLSSQMFSDRDLEVERLDLNNEHVEGLHVKSKGLKSNVLLASKIFGLIWDNRIVVYHMGIDIKL